MDADNSFYFDAAALENIPIINAKPTNLLISVEIAAPTAPSCGIPNQPLIKIAFPQYSCGIHDNWYNHDFFTMANARIIAEKVR